MTSGWEDNLHEDQIIMFTGSNSEVGIKLSCNQVT